MIKYDAHACLESNSLKQRRMELFQTSYNFMTWAQVRHFWCMKVAICVTESWVGKVLNPEWVELTTLSWPINRRTYFAHTNCHKIVIAPVPITWADSGSLTDLFFCFFNQFIMLCIWLFMLYTWLHLLTPSRKKWIVHITYIILCMDCAVWVGRYQVLK